MSPPDDGDSVVLFVLYDLVKPQVPSYSKQSNHVNDRVYDLHGGFAFALLDSLFSKGLRDAGGSFQLLSETLAESSPTVSDVDDDDLDLGERNIKHCKRKICDGHYTIVVRVLSSSGVAPYSEATLEDLKTKHPFRPAPSLPHVPIDHHHLIASSTVVLDRIKSFPHGTSCGQDGLRAQHLMDYLSGANVVVSDEFAPLIPLVKPGGGIRPIAVGTVWRVFGGSEAILHFVNCLIESCRDDVGLSMLLVDFKNTFNLVDREYLDDGTIVGDTLVVGKEDPRSRLIGIFPPNISRPLHGVKLLGGPASVDFNFCNELVMKLMAKTIVLMDAIVNINDPQCELFLLRSCTGIFRLYFTMRTCPPRVFEYAQRSFSVALRSSMKRIVNASRLGFGDWKWRLATLPFAFGGLGVYFVACSRVFNGDIYGDHAVSCVGIVGIKHRHNVVRDTLVNICYRSWYSVGKEVDIMLDRGCDKPLRPTNMLLYSWDKGLDVCVDLTGSSPLTQTGMADFVPDRAVIDVAQRKRGKNMAKCAAIGYGFLPFSFSSLGELEADAVTLLK
ncbi:hypothetical protein Tco_0717320 [Tanacetum coccineum]